jgi:hypothetical protein
MIHVFVRFCMALNPTMCFDYEIVPFGYEITTSQIHCMRGGVIFTSDHPFMLDRDGVRYLATGSVRCKADPPRDTDITDWIAAERARLSRAEPQIK